MDITRKQLTQAATILSLLFFVGSMGFSFIGLFQGNHNKQAQVATESKNKTQQMLLQEKGYLEVLKREPKNPTALQGLVEVRLASNNLKGAIAPLETLIELNPKQESLKALLKQIQTSVPAAK